jgi:light-regulated signal transduction histidine kinase (bacteriophytochrome)
VLQEDHEKDLGEAGKKTLATILANTKRMGRLIDDLLAFSLLGKHELKKAPINVNSLVKEVIEELTSPKTRSVVFRIQPLPDVHGDISMIKQVWLNLISNAIKYSSKKEKPVIIINSTTQNNNVVYSVSDNGAGFDMNYYGKLFGVFQRLHSPTDFEGTGVGLAIVNRIIAKHDGTVWAEAKPNEGATFFFSLQE